MSGRVSVGGLVEYTATQIESRAAEFLKRRVDIASRVPIDVEYMLECMPDVRLCTRNGLLVRHSVEGCVCSQFMTRRLTVYVDSTICDSTNEARYHAVLGEELAHIVLHRAIIHQVNDLDTFLEVRRHSYWRRMEADAELFSAAIRMPAVLMRQEAKAIYSDIVSTHGFADPMHVSRLVRNALAQRFVVPVEDMDRRLSRWPCDLVPAIIASAHARSLTLETEQRVFSEVIERRRQLTLLETEFGELD